MTSTTLQPFTLPLLFLLLLSPLPSTLSHPLITTSFPSITTYTALGDSYAAGHGAGSPTTTSLFSHCGRYSSAYPVQLTAAIGPVRFHSAACGGASVSSVLWDQLRWVGGTAGDDEGSDGGGGGEHLVTLTVGGNEVGFFGVLNACVYQWWGWGSGSCEVELRRSRGLISRRGLGEGFERMVREGLERVGSGRGRGRLLVTGYAAFFNEETEGCDGVSFSNRRYPKQFLTRRLRRELNQLVRLLNGIIRGAAEEAGAEYVDIDTAFEGHRFCEVGVSEPDNEREGTWFFNLRYHETGAWETQNAHHVQSQEVIPAASVDGLMDVTRVFHPTENGHGGIRDAIVEHLRHG